MTAAIGVLDRALARAFKDPEFEFARRGVAVRVVLRIDDRERQIDLSPDTEPDTSIAVDGPSGEWEKVFSRNPPPGYQSFSAIMRFGKRFVVRGHPVALARALHPLERLLEIARGEDAPNGLQLHGSPEQITGRYCDVRGARGSARIYFEHAGSGVPVLMLHTAGCDSRQFHAQLADPELTADWHLYAFDMPFHGRSFPATGWKGGEYRLTAADYADWCVAFIRQVVKQPCVVMGCSMGAAISVYLAARYPNDILGIIALEAPDKSPGRRSPLLCSPEVNQAAHNPSYVRGLMSPSSPVDMRRLACWYYSQAGLGIYSGDLAFYSEEYDGVAYAKRIAAGMPVYFLTGEYDYSATPESTRRLIAHIPNAKFIEMKGLGHFPMTEDPDRFRNYLQPVLGDIRERLTVRADNA